MAKARWDIEALRAKKAKLEKLLIDESTLKDNVAILDSIAVYDKLLYYSHTRIVDSTDYETIEMSSDEYVEEIFEDGFPCLNMEVIDSLTGAINYFKNGLGYREIPDKICIMTNEELFSIADSIFKNIGVKELYDEFIYVSDRKRCLIDIEQMRKTDIEFAGAAFVDVYNHIPYAKILRSNTIADISHLVHEIFHMIIKRYLPALRESSAQYIYHEVEGQFGDFVASDYLYKNTNEEEVRYHLNIIDNNMFQLMSGWADNAYVASATFESMSEHKSIQIGDIVRRLDRCGLAAKVNSDNLVGYVTDDLEFESYVAFGYLIALDVFKIFTDDPDKGLYLLRRVSKLSGESPKKELSGLGIHFFEDGYQTLDEKGKLLLKRSGELTRWQK